MYTISLEPKEHDKFAVYKCNSWLPENEDRNVVYTIAMEIEILCTPLLWRIEMLCIPLLWRLEMLCIPLLWWQEKQKKSLFKSSAVGKLVPIEDAATAQVTCQFSCQLVSHCVSQHGCLIIHQPTKQGCS